MTTQLTIDHCCWNFSTNNQLNCAMAMIAKTILNDNIKYNLNDLE